MDPFKQLADVSGKILTECSQYAVSVKHAKRDIERLRARLDNLNKILQHASTLVASSNAKDLIVSKGLADVFNDCQATLDKLHHDLETGNSKEMRRLGQRALEWPLKEKEVTESIAKLEKYEQSIMHGLQLDQTNMLLEIQTKLDNISLVQEQPTPEFKRAFLVPYYQDKDYIRRPTLEHWLDEQEAGDNTRFSLVGLGGFGKSQLAIEFAFKVREQTPNRHVFWVHGATSNSIEDSYREIANALAIENRSSPNVDILEIVRSRLQSETNPWLMIIDNADKMDTFFSSTGGRSIAAYLPKSNLGKILITSRSLDVAQRLTGTERAIQRVTVMGDDEALAFIRKKATREIDDADGMGLIKLLDSVPLAMNQAIAYVNRRRIPISRYMEIFQRSTKDKSALLNFDSGDIQRDEGVSNSVITTWQVTLNQIQDAHPNATKLFSLMSFFHNTTIPKMFLGQYSQEPHDDDALDDDLDVLLGYSLVTTEFDSEICEMHSLVQFCTQRWLASSNELARWRDFFIEQLCADFPSQEGMHFWKVATTTMVHLDSALDGGRIQDDDVAPYFYAVANISAVKSIEYNSARAPAFLSRMGDASLRINHLHNALLYMHTALSAYLTRGDLEKATAIHDRLIALNIETDSPDDTLQGHLKVELIRLYISQNKQDEANALADEFVQEVEERITRHTANTSLYKKLSSLDNLIRVYDYQQRTEEAEKAASRFIAICQEYVDKHTISSLVLVKTLARRYADIDRFDVVAAISHMAILISTELLGPSHLRTLEFRYREAFALAALRRNEEAEKLAEDIYAAQREHIGPTSQYTVLTMALLARVKHYNGRHAEAIAILEKGLEEAHDDRKGQMGVQETCAKLLESLKMTYGRDGKRLEVVVQEKRDVDE